MDWPKGDKLYHVEKMIEAGKNPHMTNEEAAKVINYASAYIYSLPEDIQGETAKRLVSEMGGGAERAIETLLTPSVLYVHTISAILPSGQSEINAVQPEPVQNVGTSAQVPTLPYTSKVKRKKAKL